MALPLSRASVTASQSRRRATGSMPVDGSSSKMTEGFPIRAIAALSLRLVPPLHGHGKKKNTGKGDDIQIRYLQDSVNTDISDTERLSKHVTQTSTMLIRCDLYKVAGSGADSNFFFFI